MMRRLLALLCVLPTLVACSPADLAAVNTAASVAGAAVDTFALVRAQQIQDARARASEAAAKGDVPGATEAVNEALAILATTTIEELQAVRAQLAELRTKCQVPPSLTATSSPATAPALEAP